MTMNDAQIARGWAERAMNLGLSDDVPIEGYRSAARHILATTTPPTMADIAWYDELHAGLCAESTDDGVVRMIGLDWENDHADHILCYLRPGVFDSLPMRSLTPLPGTHLDMTPRREPEPESTPSNPEVLETEEDYKNAPAGTVVAVDHCLPRVKDDDDGFWLCCGGSNADANSVMSSRARRVLRWGESL